MGLKSLFPEEMLENNNSLTLEIIASKMLFYTEQLHLLHFQTKSYSEHFALNIIYNVVGDLKDEVIEKIMGYTGKRIKAYKLEPLKDYTPSLSIQIGKELGSFAEDLEEFGDTNNMPDIENIAQGLSGEAAQFLYRLTLT